MRYRTTCCVAWALLSLLAGCANNPASMPFSAAQCADLTALRNKEPLTRERNLSELAALERAGYNPGWRFDPFYPQDLEVAQRRVDNWYQTECVQARGDTEGARSNQ